MTCDLEQCGERISQSNVGALQVGSITYEIVTQIVVVAGSYTCKAQCHSFGSRVVQSTVGIQTRLADHCTVGQKVIVNIVTEGSTERHAQIPILIEEFSGKAHDDIGRGFLVEIAVTIVNTSVTVTVHIHTFNGFAILVIYLLIYKE